MQNNQTNNDFKDSSTSSIDDSNNTTQDSQASFDQKSTKDANDLSQISKLGQQILQSDDDYKQSDTQDINDSVINEPNTNNKKPTKDIDKILTDASLPSTINNAQTNQKHRFWHLKTRKHKIIFISIIVFLIIITSAIGAFFWISANNINKRQQANLIDSNIYISGINVSNLHSAKAQEVLQDAINKQKIVLTVNDQTVEASPTDLGISYKPNDTIQDAIKKRRPLLAELGIIKKEPISIKPNVQINNQILADYINSKVGAQLLSKNAELVIENNQLIIKPSAQGAAIDINDLTNQVSALQLSQDNVAITALTTITEPDINTTAAEKAKQELDTYLAPNYSVGNQSLGYKDVAFANKLTWLVISPNPEKKAIDTSVDTNKINQSLDTLIKSFNLNAQDRVLVILPGGQNIISQEGYDGVNVPAESLNSAKTALNTSINQKQPAKVELATQPIARNQKTLDGFEKMILVNKASYKTQAIQNGQVQKEVIVSTGKPGFETPNGTYNILRKKAISDMKGCGGGECWEVKNVKWQSYFTNEGHAIHGTWWYINYGNQNASHGCVNMREADAEWFYNWLDIGTPVVVI